MVTDFICSVPQRVILASGQKAESLLQGQLTCDVREVTAAQSRLAAHCNPKGRIQSSLRLLQFGGVFYGLLPEEMVDFALAQLNKYAMLSRVKLAGCDRFSLLGCYGENVANTLMELAGKLPVVVDEVCSGADWLLVRIPGAKPRFLLMAEAERMKAWQDVLSLSYPVSSWDAWRQQDIEAGLAQIYPQTIDLFTPQMLNYPELNAVSFEKGCYIGQEIIARTHYLGKVKRHLQHLVLATPTLPQVGEKLWTAEGQEAGIIVDAVRNTAEDCQILAVVQDTAPLAALTTCPRVLD